MDKSERAEKLIAEMKADRGYIYEQWEFAARQDPDFVTAYNNLYRSALNSGEALDVVTRELVACGVLCFRNQTNGVKTHMIRAIKFGATKQQLLEAVETCIVPGGAPTFFTGLDALIQALKECEEKGIEVK
jgi:4-carboxymuconolactone decarboxylase